jgi:mannitol/fructose-specific phosphotransferase system IIA component (Ntr-type)
MNEGIEGPGMRLRDLLDEASVKVGLESVDKEECIEELVDVLVRGGRIADRAGALKALRTRETMATTGIGKGVAVPHGKHDSIPKLVAVFGTSREGIEFDAIDGEPVHMVVLLLASSDQTGPHLRAMVEIARLVQVPGFYRKAVEARTSAELLDLIDSEE